VGYPHIHNASPRRRRSRRKRKRSTGEEEEERRAYLREWQKTN
jgi:hypothetical protein